MQHRPKDDGGWLPHGHIHEKRRQTAARSTNYGHPHPQPRGVKHPRERHPGIPGGSDDAQQAAGAAFAGADGSRCVSRRSLELQRFLKVGIWAVKRIWCGRATACGPATAFAEVRGGTGQASDALGRSGWPVPVAGRGAPRWRRAGPGPRRRRQAGGSVGAGLRSGGATR